MAVQRAPLAAAHRPTRRLRRAPADPQPATALAPRVLRRLVPQQLVGPLACRLPPVPAAPIPRDRESHPRAPSQRQAPPRRRMPRPEAQLNTPVQAPGHLQPAKRVQDQVLAKGETRRVPALLVSAQGRAVQTGSAPAATPTRVAGRSYAAGRSPD